MTHKSIIAILARMDLSLLLNLLPAMGRTWEDTRAVQDVESPHLLGNGLKNRVVNMVLDDNAKEVFIVGSAVTETPCDVRKRIETLLACDEFPSHIPVHGLLFDPDTYKLELVRRGYSEEVG